MDECCEIEIEPAEVYDICLICGMSVKSPYSPACGYHPFICDECKKAVMWAKTRMDGDVLTS